MGESPVSQKKPSIFRALHSLSFHWPPTFQPLPTELFGRLWGQKYQVIQFVTRKNPLKVTNNLLTSRIARYSWIYSSKKKSKGEIKASLVDYQGTMMGFIPPFIRPYFLRDEPLKFPWYIKNRSANWNGQNLVAILKFCEKNTRKSVLSMKRVHIIRFSTALVTKSRIKLPNSSKTSPG